MLRDLATITGVYVPSLYDVDYNEDGTIARIAPNRPGVMQTKWVHVVRVMAP